MFGFYCPLPKPSRRLKRLTLFWNSIPQLLHGSKEFRGMPDDAKVKDVQFDGTEIQFTIESDTFPEVPDGAPIPDLVVGATDITWQPGRRWI